MWFALAESTTIVVVARDDGIARRPFFESPIRVLQRIGRNGEN